MSKSLKQMCLVGVIVAAATVSGGCNNGITGDTVRGDWSPELHSFARGFEQHRNMEARTIDTNGRQAWDDGAMLLLLHRPMRLTRYPIP